MSKGSFEAFIEQKNKRIALAKRKRIHKQYGFCVRCQSALCICQTVLGDFIK